MKFGFKDIDALFSGHSGPVPEEEKQRVQMSAFVFHTGKRKSRQGRPTKKDKRDLDEFLDE